MVLKCFKAYQYIQRLVFTESKRNMVILASNCLGKTGAVDGFEYILSEDGSVERIGEEENKLLNKAGSDALKNIYRASEKNPTSVRVEIEAYDENSNDKVESFLIERTVGISDRPKTEIHTTFLNALRVSPIIRGEESNSFVTELSPLQRFEKIAIWVRRKSLLVILNQLREVVAKTPTTLSAIESEIVSLNTNLENATNQKILEWGETSVLEYINDELLVQFEPKLRMSKLTRSDPTFVDLKENFKTLANPSLKVQKISKQQKIIENIEQLMDFGEELSRLFILNENTTNSMENAKKRLKMVSRELFSEIQGEIDQLLELINEYFQYITGDTNKKAYLQIELNKQTDEGLIHLTTDMTKKIRGLQPSGYLSNAEKHAFALAFQLAYIRVFNRDAKILILDDLVTSIDAGYRNRIVSLIFEKFSDFQIIATTHDDLFFLSIYASADPKNWTFCRIIRVDPDHGPVFDIFRPTKEEMQFLWDHKQSALTLLRQQMEHDFAQLIKDLNIKLRMLKSVMFDSYSLNEKITAVRDFFNKAGLAVPKFNDVEKQTLDYFAEAKLLNVGIHDREETHSTMSIEDEQKLMKQYYLFKSWLVCDCKNDRFRRQGKIDGKVKPKMMCRNCNREFKFNKGV